MPPKSSAVRSEIIDLLARAGIAQGAAVRTSTLAAGTIRSSLDDGGLRWILATEQPATVFDWDYFDFVDEVLLMDGLVLPDIRQVPLLDSHNRRSVDDHLGSVSDIQIAQAGGYLAKDGLVRFAADEKSQRTQQKVLDRHITDGSVGYIVTRSVWIPEGTEAAVKGRTFAGPLKVSYEWALKEFSITPIGADTLAKVRSLCAPGSGGRLATPRR